MRVYGIPNCNTVKKAVDWLKNNKLPFEFYDYKKNGITTVKLQEWSQKVGWEKLINKKGTTWRALTTEQQQKVTDVASAIELMIEKPSVIKRPLIETGKKIIDGFDEENYKTSFKTK